MKTENNPPTFRLNQDQQRVIFGLFAGLQQFCAADTLMPQRISAIPHGKRDLHLIMTVGRKLIDNIVNTVPEEKRDAVKRQGKHARFDILITPRMNLVEKNEIVTAAADLNAVMYYAHEQCRMCIDGSCRKCPLGRALDHLVTYDREDKSWSNVDFSGLMD